MEIVFVVLVVGWTAMVVGYPLWRPAPAPPPDPVGPAARLVALQERKQSIYAAIRELGFDYRTDKLSAADYQDEVDRLKAEAVEVLSEMDEIAGSTPRGPQHLEREISAAVDRLRGVAPADAPAATPSMTSGEATFCTQCGKQAAPEDRFCGACGTRLRRAE